MPVIECPKCQRHYDPGNEDALEATGSMMSLKVPCPACGQWLRLPEYECVAAPNVPPNILEEMKKQSVLLPEGDPTPVTFGPGGTFKPKKKPWWAFWR